MTDQKKKTTHAAGAGRTASKKTRKKKRMSGRVWFYTVFFSVVIAIVCAMIGYLLIVLNGERLLEEHGSKLDFGEASIIYDAQGEEFARLYHYEDHREIADFSEIPEHLREAIVATEDQRFYEHSGLDFWAIGRALVKDVVARRAVEGGSTITQQLAKNVFLSADKTFFRKATEASIAVALEQHMSKDDILAMYLNRIYFGKGIYGVKAAAKYYFDKDLSELELWESATLAAMPKAPNRYNPVNDPEASMQRRAVVLKLMYDQKYITEEEMNEAKAVVYERPANQEQMKDGSYEAFVDYVLDEAMEVTNMTEEELRVSGLKIYTTLNQQAQKAMEAEFADDANFEKSVDETLAQASMVIVDHRNGEIKALAGGRGYEAGNWNRAVKPRQPGSAIKPIVSYGPALESGNYFPWTTLANDKTCFGNYCPRDRWGATPVTMTKAMEDSRNLAAVWMLNQVGIQNGIDFATKLGIEFEKEDRNLSIALGGMTKGASPLQMATAYSVMANGGLSVDPHAIVKIDGKTRTVYEYKAPESKRLMKEDTAWYLTEMMISVVKNGTGKKAAFDRPVAGKTGTTQHGIPGLTSDGIRDAWFVGYTPEWTAAVWMGYDKSDADHLLKNGSAQSAAFFSKVMKQAMKGVPQSSFKQPQIEQEETPPPMQVTNLNAAFDPEQVLVTLSWDPIPGEGITYEVFRRESGSDRFEHFVDSLTTPSVNDMAVFPGMTYEYYVVAYDPETNAQSEPSNRVKVDIPDVEIDIPGLPMEPTPTDPVVPDPGGEDGGAGDGGGSVEEPGDGSSTPWIPEIPELPGTDPGQGGQPTSPGESEAGSGEDLPGDIDVIDPGASNDSVIR